MRILVLVYSKNKLMRTFTMPPLNFLSNFVVVNVITSSTMESSDPWIVPLESELSSYRNEMPLSPLELVYQVVQLFFDPSSYNIDRVDTINDNYSPLPWLEPFSLSDRLKCTFPTYESIMELMLRMKCLVTITIIVHIFYLILIKSRMIFQNCFHLR